MCCSGLFHPDSRKPCSAPYMEVIEVSPAAGDFNLPSGAPVNIALDPHSSPHGLDFPSGFNGHCPLSLSGLLGEHSPGQALSYTTPWPQVFKGQMMELFCCMSWGSAPVCPAQFLASSGSALHAMKFKALWALSRDSFPPVAPFLCMIRGFVW